VVSYRSQDRNHTQPLAGVKVLAYTRAFPVVGPIMADGPTPVAHTISGSDGRFVLRGLKPGRYFLVAESSGHWVRLSPWTGATLTIAVCRDCPLPL